MKERKNEIIKRGREKGDREREIEGEGEASQIKDNVMDGVGEEARGGES